MECSLKDQDTYIIAGYPKIQYLPDIWKIWQINFWVSSKLDIWQNAKSSQTNPACWISSPTLIGNNSLVRLYQIAWKWISSHLNSQFFQSVSPGRSKLQNINPCSFVYKISIIIRKNSIFNKLQYLNWDQQIWYQIQEHDLFSKAWGGGREKDEGWK